MKKLKLSLCLFAILLLTATNSCKKDDRLVPAGSPPTSLTVISQLPASQRVQMVEMLSWVGAHFGSTGLQPAWGQAAQTISNGKHVIELPITNCSALFFTKTNGVLEVYAYKWMAKNPGAKKFTGGVSYFSFQNNTMTVSGYIKGKLVKSASFDLTPPSPTTSTTTILANKPAPFKSLNSSIPGFPITSGAKTLDSNDSGPAVLLAMLECWISGGTWTSGYGTGGCNFLNQGQSWFGTVFSTIKSFVDDLFASIFGGSEDDDGNDAPATTYTQQQPDGSTVTIDGSYITTGGMVYITVSTPAPSGGPSDGTGDQTTQDGFTTDPNSGNGTTVSQWVPVMTANVIATSVINDPYLKTVYNNLQNNTVYQGLIKGFVGSNTYNLTLKVGSVAPYNATGITFPDPNNANNVVTTFDKNQTATLSIGEWGETFLHEAYHAYIDLLLAQSTNMGQAAFNTTYANSFDLIVSQRVAAATAPYTAQGLTITAQQNQQIQHDAIAQDIVKLGAGLQQFIETIYPAVKSDPLYTPTLYQNMIWAGLKDSQAFTTTWGLPSTWGTNSQGNPNSLPPDVNTALGLIQQIPAPQ